MTIEAGVKFDIASVCDDLLEFLHQRRGGGVDINEIELNYRSEYIETAANKLEAEGYIEVIETKDACFYKITPRGQVQYRTSSFVQEESDKKKDKKFSQFKSVAEVVFGVVTIVLTISTFTLDNKVDEQEEEIESLRTSLAEQQEVNSKLLQQVGKQEANLSEIISRLHDMEISIREAKTKDLVNEKIRKNK